MLKVGENNTSNHVFSPMRIILLGLQPITPYEKQGLDNKHPGLRANLALARYGVSHIH